MLFKEIVGVYALKSHETHKYKPYVEMQSLWMFKQMAYVITTGL
jgi:hypothetical protein